MSLTAAVIAELVGAGLSGEALVSACERIEASRKPVRSSAAERQARYRERQKASRVTSRDACDVTTSAPKDVEPKLPTVENNQSPTTPLYPPAARRFDDWPEDFGEELWAIYPRKTEKKAGMDALARLHRLDRLSWAELIRGVHALDDCDPQFVPALARWLKGERWKDERPAPGRAPPHRQARRNTALDGLDELERRFTNVQHQPNLRIAG